MCVAKQEFTSKGLRRFMDYSLRQPKKFQGKLAYEKYTERFLYNSPFSVYM